MKEKGLLNMSIHKSSDDINNDIKNLLNNEDSILKEYNSYENKKTDDSSNNITNNNIMDNNYSGDNTLSQEVNETNNNDNFKNNTNNSTTQKYNINSTDNHIKNEEDRTDYISQNKDSSNKINGNIHNNQQINKDNINNKLKEFNNIKKNKKKHHTFLIISIILSLLLLVIGIYIIKSNIINNTHRNINLTSKIKNTSNKNNITNTNLSKNIKKNNSNRIKKISQFEIFSYNLTEDVSFKYIPFNENNISYLTDLAKLSSVNHFEKGYINRYLKQFVISRISKRPFDKLMGSPIVNNCVYNNSKLEKYFFITNKWESKVSNNFEININNCSILSYLLNNNALKISKNYTYSKNNSKEINQTIKKIINNLIKHSLSIFEEKQNPSYHLTYIKIGVDYYKSYKNYINYNNKNYIKSIDIKIKDIIKRDDLNKKTILNFKGYYVMTVKIKINYVDINYKKRLPKIRD